jgi:hypothetical protein
MVANRGLRSSLGRAGAANLAAGLGLAAALTGLAASAQEADRPADIPTALGVELTQGSPVAYVSDYLSFAGRDAAGFVLFALDTNRGRDESEYQAEHFVAMFDEHDGWIDVPGYDAFPNPDGRLHAFPESPFFELTGEPYALATVRSKSMALALTIGAIEERITETDERTVFSLGSGPATLEWNSRQIEGRVIYEYLAMAGENRLARGLGGALDMVTEGPNFQGLYLTTDAGDDLYVHVALSSAASGLGDPVMAFATRNGRSQPIKNLVLDVVDFDPALGFYRWPGAWAVEYDSDCGYVEAALRTRAHDTQANWILGGFAMRAVTGTLTCGARTVSIYGFAELIR